MSEYDFTSLSPIDFEQLVRDLLSVKLSLDFASYAQGPDGGVDLRAVTAKGAVVVQCKHLPAAKPPLLKRVAASEVERHPSLQGVDAYLFATSASMSPDVEQGLVQALHPLPVPQGGIWHRGRLNQALSEYPHIERRHFKLWLASSAIFNEMFRPDQWQQSEDLVERITERARLYVRTPAYDRALSILEAKNVVTITGPPGAGKSTLAEMLLLTLSRSGWTVINVTGDIDDAWQRLSRPEAKEIYYYDDFLGQTSMTEVSKGESSRILSFIARVRSGSGSRRLIVTSRDQVLAQAKVSADDRLRRLIEDHGGTHLSVGALSRLDKARIFVNHLHFGVTGAIDRQNLAGDKRCLSVIDHPNFTPRGVEAAVLRQEFQTVDAMLGNLLAGLDNPAEQWAGSYAALPEEATKILTFLATSVERSHSLRRLLDLNRSSIGRRWEHTMQLLEGSWVSLFSSSATGPPDRISLIDGSRRDFLLGLLSQDGHLCEAVEVAAHSSQLLYITALSGLSNADGEGWEVTGKAALHHAVSARLDELQQKACQLAYRELQEAKDHQSKLVTGTRGSGGKKRLEAIQRLVSASHLKYRPELGFETIIDDEISALALELQQGCVASAQSVFAIANEMVSGRSHAHSDSSIDDIVRFGAGRMVSFEDADAYERLDESLVSSGSNREFRKRLPWVFELEVDRLLQQNEADIVEYQIKDLQQRSDRYRVAIPLEALYDHLVDLHAPQKVATSDVNRFEQDLLPNPDSKSEDEDNEILRLLCSLAAPSNPDQVNGADSNPAKTSIGEPK